MSEISSQQKPAQVSSRQIRAARGLLGLSSEKLAELATVGWATVRRYEEVDGIPASRGGTLMRVKEALENEGIEFIGDPVRSPGVRLRADHEKR